MGRANTTARICVSERRLEASWAHRTGCGCRSRSGLPPSFQGRAEERVRFHLRADGASWPENGLPLRGRRTGRLRDAIQLEGAGEVRRVVCGPRAGTERQGVFYASAAKPRERADRLSEGAGEPAAGNASGGLRRRSLGHLARAVPCGDATATAVRFRKGCGNRLRRPRRMDPRIAVGAPERGKAKTLRENAPSRIPGEAQIFKRTSAGSRSERRFTGPNRAVSKAVATSPAMRR